MSISFLFIFTTGLFLLNPISVKVQFTSSNISVVFMGLVVVNPRPQTVEQQCSSSCTHHWVGGV